MFGPHGPTLRELLKQALSSTKEGYDQLAPKFDRTPFLTSGDVLCAMANSLKNRHRYESALDLCTGTGAAITMLMEFVKKEIVGVDWSAPMLAEARRKCNDLGQDAVGLPEVDLVHADVFNLRCRESFDLVTCFGALGHFERKKREVFLDLAFTALKPGGDLVIDVLDLPLYSPMLWTLFAFDAVMYLRNILIRPPFIMYYLHWLKPAVLPMFNRERWRSVSLVPVIIKGKRSPFCLLIATKR